jgi:hypothetical protein
MTTLVGISAAGNRRDVPHGSLYLLSLLVVPGLLGLMVLMEVLERVFAGRMVADELAVLMGSGVSPEDLEERVAVAAQPLFRSAR